MRVYSGWFVLAVLFNLSCEHADPLGAGRADPVEPTLSFIQTTIFSRSCALSGCHAGSNPQMGLDLSEGAAHASLVGVRSREVPDLFRVSAGDPAASYLVMKITGASGIVGAQMPLTGESLTQEQIDVVTEWIRLGALDN